MPAFLRVQRKYLENLKGSSSTAVGHGLLTRKGHLQWFEFSGGEFTSFERGSLESIPDTEGECSELS